MEKVKDGGAARPLRTDGKIKGKEIMMTYRYTAVLEREADGGYHASCPALPGCHSQGDTVEKALANMKEAIAVYIESLKAHNEPLPVEDILIKSMEVAIPA